MEIVFQIAILIMSVVIHEVSHGYMASFLGDETARYQGRLTLNPLKHLDPFGSVFLPLLLAISHAGVIFGWAKPVPYNPYNLRPGRFSEAAVAAAGPVTNITIAILFGLLLRFSIVMNAGFATTAFVQIVSVIVFINIILAVFNLVPIPPLDGSKLLFAFFPESTYKIRAFFERYGFILIILFILFVWQLISPVIFWIFGLITGLNLF